MSKQRNLEILEARMEAIAAKRKILIELRDQSGNFKLNGKIGQLTKAFNNHRRMWRRLNV